MLAAEETREPVMEAMAQAVPRQRPGRIIRKIPGAMVTVGPIRIPRPRVQRTLPR